MSHVCLVRQRPGIGDVVCLSPVIRAIRRKHPKNKLIVVTDQNYASGALTRAFEMIPEVDKVITKSPLEWTTASNRFRGEPSPFEPDPPAEVKRAKAVYDANGAFIIYESKFKGFHLPEFGITDFWLHCFGLRGDGKGPKIVPNQKAREEAAEWLGKPEKPMVGIVLRSGHPARDYDYQRLAANFADHVYTKGYTPITIDPAHTVETRGRSLVGKPVDVVAAVIEKMAVVLTPDTGLMHIAEALGVPTISMWGVVSPELRAKGYKTIAVPEKPYPNCGHCVTCRYPNQRYSCMNSLTIRDLTNAFDKWETKVASL